MSDESSKWYYGVPAVLLGLILLGPFAFPILWKSPRFNMAWKIILTAAVTLLTVYMIAGTVKIAEYTVREIQRLQQAMAPACLLF